MLVNPMIISTKCIDLLLCTFKTGHLLLIIMVTDCINQLRKNNYSQTIFLIISKKVWKSCLLSSENVQIYPLP